MAKGRRFSVRAAALAAGVATAHASAFLGPAALAAEGGKAVLVLDSTADMRTLFGSETKSLAASNSIANTLPSFESRLDLGFLVYGHHSSNESACDKTVLRRPPDPLVAAEITETLGELKAKGHAAVARAIEVAAVDSRIAETGGSLVLIAGGGDSCKADPCATAAKLADYPSIRVHVIGVDSGQETAELEGLRCLADRTGGSFWRATSAIELTNAIDSALTLAAAYNPNRPATTFEGATAGGTAPSVPLSTELGATGAILDGTIPVTLTALLTDAGPQIDQGLTWRIFEGTRSPGGGYKLLATSTAARPELSFPTGRFYVNVSFGKANHTRRIDVAGTGGVEKFVLNAGALRLLATRTNGGSAPVGAVTFNVFSEEQDQAGERVLVLSNVKTGTMLRLNAGIYHVVATHGDANAVTEAEVGVEAGKITEAAITLTGAAIGFKLVAQSGGEALADTTWSILSPEGKVIKQSAGALPTHVLAPGRYVIQAKRGEQIFTAPFIVEPGEDKIIEVVAETE